MKRSFYAAIATMTLCSSVSAQDFFNNDVSIGGSLCVGSQCSSSESFPTGETIKLEGNNLGIRFRDLSDPSGSFPYADWTIQANDRFNGGDNFFAVLDVSRNTTPFKIRNNAPSHALTIAPSGDIGMGTNLPESEMHIVGDFAATISLEKLSLSPYRWDLNAANEFNVRDATAGTFPFVIRAGAPTYSIITSPDGDIGLGTGLPDGKLHVSNEGVQLNYFESSDGGPVQVRFRTNSQNRRFLAVNNADEVKSQIVFGDDQIQFLGETVAQEWLRISSAGIVSSGPTCNPNPCDRTFDPDAFTVPAIEDRAASMWENMHLPAVGPTAPEQPFNVTEKMGGVIHELEIAHIYIEQLHDEQQALKLSLQAETAEKAAMLAQIADLAARLDAMER